MMSPGKITNGHLIKLAHSVVKPRTIRNGFTVSEVGCALITDKGNVYVGTNIDASSGMGFCAEHSAIASMISHGEGRIEKIVAVSKRGEPMSPCGRCREFIHQIHDDNLETDVILGLKKVVKLSKLLPYVWDR